jgi:hypothetical protein
MSAAANGHSRPPAQTEFLPVLIHDFKITFDANRTIAEYSYFGCCHKFLRKMTHPLDRAMRLQDSGGCQRIQEPLSAKIF